MSLGLGGRGQQMAPEKAPGPRGPAALVTVVPRDEGAALPPSSSGSPASYTSLFLDYGVIEGLSVTATLYVEVPMEIGAPQTAAAGLQARKRMWQGEAGDVVSVQVGVRHPLDDLLGAPFGGPGADPMQEVSLRLLYGRGFGGDWGTAFVSLEAGYHLQTDGDDDEARMDVTVGYGPDPCCLALLGAYVTAPLGPDAAAGLTLAPSLAYTFGTGAGEDGDGEENADEDMLGPVTVQIGLSQDLLDLGGGFGVSLGLWQPF
jgi:hypothetical protein